MKIGKLLAYGLAVFACLYLFAPMAAAQYRAGIQGHVLDPQGNAIAAASVTLTNLETNKTQQVSSDEAGVFNFLSLPPGHYSIQVEIAQPEPKPGIQHRSASRDSEFPAVH
jgi:hypothetical protein